MSIWRADVFLCAFKNVRNASNPQILSQYYNFFYYFYLLSCCNILYTASLQRIVNMESAVNEKLEVILKTLSRLNTFTEQLLKLFS